MRFGQSAGPIQSKSTDPKKRREPEVVTPARIRNVYQEFQSCLRRRKKVKASSK